MSSSNSPSIVLLLPALFFCLADAGAQTQESCFGSYELSEGVVVAAQTGVWTFEDPVLPAEGWVADHPFDPQGPDIVRWRELADFAGDGFPVGGPIIAGEGMIWAGRHAAEADSLCFECGLGYGIGVQRIRSPWIPYSGGQVVIDFDYFQDIWNQRMALRVFSDASDLYYSTFDIGDGSTGSWETPAHHSEVVTGAFLNGASVIAIEFLLSVKGGPTDEDCSYDSQLGAFGVDDVTVSGGSDVFYDFEGSSQGWTTLDYGSNPEPGPYFSIRPLSSYGEGYEQLPCSIDNNVMTFHGAGVFPEGYRLGATSPVIDLRPFEYVGLQSAELTLDLLQDYQTAGLDPGLWFQTFVRFYPAPCAVGGPRWTNWTRVWDEPIEETECGGRSINLMQGIEEPAELVQVHVGVYSCAACCVESCADPQFTPFLDNLQVCFEGATATSVEVEPDASVSPAVVLSSHPVVAASILHLELDSPSIVRASLLDVTGRRVGTLFEGPLDGSGDIPIGVKIQAIVGNSHRSVYLLHIEGKGWAWSKKILWSP